MAQISRKSDTLRRILVAARVEFAEKGLDAARLEGIARAAGVTKQLVHHYFSNKEELYQIVFDSISQSVLTILDESNYESLTPTEAIRLLINSIIDLHLEKPAITTFTLDQALHRAAQINAQTCFVPLTREFIHNVIDPILRHGARLGEFRGNVDATLFYGTVYHIATGCFLLGPAMTQTMGVDLDSPEGIARWRDHALSFILASLRPDGQVTQSREPLPAAVTLE